MRIALAVAVVAIAIGGCAAKNNGPVTTPGKHTVALDREVGANCVSTAGPHHSSKTVTCPSDTVRVQINNNGKVDWFPREAGVIVDSAQEKDGRWRVSFNVQSGVELVAISTTREGNTTPSFVGERTVILGPGEGATNEVFVKILR